MPENGIIRADGSPYLGGSARSYVRGNDGNVYQVKNVRSPEKTGTGYCSVDVVDPWNPDGLPKAKLYRVPGGTHWKTQKEVGLQAGVPAWWDKIRSPFRASEENMAREVFREVRDAYSKGAKSGNKAYQEAFDPNDVYFDRSVKANETLKKLRQKTEINLRTGTIVHR